MKLSTIPELVRDLGYCCPYLFFSLFHSRSTIATRLGVHPRTASTWKKRLRDRELKCARCPECKIALLRAKNRKRAE